MEKAQANKNMTKPQYTTPQQQEYSLCEMIDELTKSQYTTPQQPLNVLFIDRYPEHWNDPSMIKLCLHRQKMAYKTLLGWFGGGVYFAHDFLKLDEELLRRVPIVVTHLPEDPDKTGFSYQRSLEKLRRISGNANHRIIIRTDVSSLAVSDEDLREAGASGVLIIERISPLQDIEQSIKHRTEIPLELDNLVE